MSTFRFFKLFKLYFRTKFFFIKDIFWALRFHFFRYLLFLPFDLFLIVFSLFINPYRYSRKYFFKKILDKTLIEDMGKNKSKNSCFTNSSFTSLDESFFLKASYGETPLKAMTQISQKAGLTSQDVILELGSGRGRASFWLFSFLHCRVIGIEQISLFVFFSQALGFLYNLADLLFWPFFKFARYRKPKFTGLNFYKKDYFAYIDNYFKNKQILAEITAVYLYGSNLEDDFLQKLIKKLENFPVKTKIITISYALCEYNPNFYTAKKWQITFPWGTTEAFLNFYQ